MVHLSMNFKRGTFSIRTNSIGHFLTELNPLMQQPTLWRFRLGRREEGLPLFLGTV